MKKRIKSNNQAVSFTGSVRTLALCVCFSVLGTAQAQDGVEYVEFNETVIMEAPLEETPVVDTSEEVSEPKFIHELSFWGSAGISALGYEAAIGDKSIPFGGAFGIGYSGFFHKNWGFGVGAELALYQASVKMDKLSYRYDTKDIDGKNINYRSSIANYKESQRLYNLNIPVVAYYQRDVFDNVHKFYASAGFKLGIPMKGEYKGKNGTLTASGYYPEYDQELTTQTDMGYGTFPVKTKSRDLDFDLAYMATLEAGIKWNLSRRLWLYTGVYGDYGFNDIRKEKDRALVAYNIYEPSDMDINSVVSSRYKDGDASKTFTDKVYPWAVGLKVKLGITLNRLPKEAAPETVYYDDVLGRLADTQGEILDFLRNQKPLTEEAIRGIIDDVMRDYLKGAEERKKKFEDRMLGVDNYNLDISKLTTRQMNELNDYIDVMKENGNAIMVIVGNTCDLGTDAYNMALGQERADRAKDYMVGNGIHPTRITTLSAGETNPIAPNNSEQNRRLNRRLEIMMTNLDPDAKFENNRYYRITD